MSARPPRPPAHPVDLRGPDRWVALGAAVSVGIATSAGASRFGLPLPLTFLAGAAVGVLAVVALPSIPTRLATPLVVASGGFVLTRYARTGAVSAPTVALWAVTTLATFVALERAEREHRRPLTATRTAGHPTIVLVVGAALVGLAALVLWPVLAVGGAPHDRGDAADPFSDDATANLFDRGVMDTRGRPRLGDEVVMYVTAERPAFWRGATYDRWDGTSWYRTDERAATLISVTGAFGDPAPVPAGLGVVSDLARPNEQTFELVAPSSEIVFAAPEPVEVRSDHLVTVRPDGTLAAPNDPLGAGARYTVRSAEPNATVATLRAASGPVPADIAARYSAPATATARVRDLARRITADAPTAYDKVRAIERWLDQNVEYSLDAPLPDGDVRDVVDWFVFDGRAGWCEQIASTFVVMLREVGVPARVATGFVTGDLDPLTGRYVVRAKHAHAWAEVWFPGVGWQGFDPTASVPLAGESEPGRSLFTWVRGHALLVAAMVGALVLGGIGAASAGRRIRARRAARRAPWSTRTVRGLERLGATVDRARAPGETPTAYAAALAALLDAPELAEIGRVVDADAYGPVPADAATRRRVDELVAR